MSDKPEVVGPVDRIELADWITDELAKLRAIDGLLRADLRAICGCLPPLIAGTQDTPSARVAELEGEVARLYESVPSLPITAENAETATSVLTDLCNVYGVIAMRQGKGESVADTPAKEGR